MTRKDFQLIADTIREAGPGTYVGQSTHQSVRLAQHFADVLATTNPNFDRARFIRACMPSWVEGTSHAKVWEAAL